MKSRFGSLIASAALALTAVFPAAAQKVELTPGFPVDGQLLREAQKEGSVSFWCSLARAGMRLGFQAVRGTDEGEGGLRPPEHRAETLTRTVRKERAANIHSVDVISHSDPERLGIGLQAEKWLVKYVPQGAQKYHRSSRIPTASTSRIS